MPGDYEMKLTKWIGEKVDQLFDKAAEHVAGTHKAPGSLRVNSAQRMLMQMGVEPAVLLGGTHGGKTLSATRKGPGRMHQQGKRK